MSADMGGSTTLGAICEVNPPRPKLTGRANDTPVLFVPMSAVDDVTGEVAAAEHRWLGTVRDKSFRTFTSGDVIFAKITPCMENGKSAVVPTIESGLGFGSTEFHVLRPRPGVSPQFIWHFVRQRSFRRAAEQQLSGSVGQLRVPSEFLRDFPIDLPTKERQDEVVEDLDSMIGAAREASAHVRAAKRAVERWRQAVLAAACSGRLTADWRKEHPDLARRVPVATRSNEVEELVEAPDEWAWAHLADIADLKGGVQKGAKFSSGEPTREVPYLRVANVQRGWLDLAEIKTIVVPESKIKEVLLEPGDVLFNEGGDRDKLGRGWVWEGQIPECIHQNHVFRARLRDGAMQPRFYSWFGNTFGAAYFEAGGKQTVNLASLNMSTLKALPVPVLAPEEQAEIVRRVDALLSLASALENRIGLLAQRVERSSEAVLATAFAGELLNESHDGDMSSELVVGRS